jgi:hypothetical protein
MTFHTKFSLDFSSKENWSTGCIELVAMDQLFFFSDGYLWDQIMFLRSRRFVFLWHPVCQTEKNGNGFSNNTAIKRTLRTACHQSKI